MTADPPPNVMYRFGHSLPEKLWCSWKLISWSLPPALFLVRFPAGGWETIALMFTLPLWWPAVSLLSLLPRFILRRRGFDFLPAAVGIPMAGVLWGFGAFMLAMPGEGDSGSLPSQLNGMLPFLGQRGEKITFVLALLLCVSSWIVAVIVACFLRPGATEKRQGIRIIIGAGSVVVGFIAAVLSIAVVMMWGPKDGAGDRELTATLMSQQAAFEREQKHWEELQRNIQPVREVIAEDGWMVDDWTGPHSDFDGTYRIAARWSMIMKGRTPDLARELRSLLEAEGWTLHQSNSTLWGDAPAEQTLQDDEGNIRYVSYLLQNAAGLEVVLTLENTETSSLMLPKEASDGDVLVTVSMLSNWYWVERGEGRSILFADWASSSSDDVVMLGYPEPTTFGAEEWPSLTQIRR